MNLRSVDLNLLVILDALLDEAHVSRAARRLNLSQPAASAALQRCRALFGDDLLERGRGTMRRTPKADAMRAPLKSLLADMAELIDPSVVPLAEISRVVHLSMADHPAVAIVAPLQRRLAGAAPGIDVVIQPWHGSEASVRALRTGETDIAVSVFGQEAEDIVRRKLSDETYVVALRAGHPAAAGFDLESWLAWPHVVVSGHGARHGNLDEILAERGLCRRIGLVVPSFQMVPAILAQSDAIALMPSRTLSRGTLQNLLILDPPLPVPGFPLHMAWHRRQDGDPVIDLIAGLLSEVLAAGPRDGLTEVVRAICKMHSVDNASEISKTTTVRKDYDKTTDICRDLRSSASKPEIIDESGSN